MMLPHGVAAVGKLPAIRADRESTSDRTDDPANSKGQSRSSQKPSKEVADAEGAQFLDPEARRSPNTHRSKDVSSDDEKGPLRKCRGKLKRKSHLARDIFAMKIVIGVTLLLGWIWFKYSPKKGASLSSVYTVGTTLAEGQTKARGEQSSQHRTQHITESSTSAKLEPSTSASSEYDDTLLREGVVRTFSKVLWLTMKQLQGVPFLDTEFGRSSDSNFRHRNRLIPTEVHLYGEPQLETLPDSTVIVKYDLRMHKVEIKFEYRWFSITWLTCQTLVVSMPSVSTVSEASNWRLHMVNITVQPLSENDIKCRRTGLDRALYFFIALKNIQREENHVRSIFTHYVRAYATKELVPAFNERFKPYDVMYPVLDDNNA